MVPLRPNRGGRSPTGIVDAIAIRDQALAIAAQVEQRIPVRAITGEPGDVVGQDDPDLAQGDAGDQVLEAAPVLGGGPAQAEIDIDDLDVGLPPAESQARWRGAYCRRRLSWLLRTWCGWDWRM